MPETPLNIARKPDELPQAKVRDSRSDYFKAASIIAVVCIHAGLPYYNSLRFCIPVFIALWAYHFENGLSRRNSEQFWPYIIQRFLRLLVPYFFWTSVYLFLSHSFSELIYTPFHTVLDGWLGGYGWPGQYFFLIIFQLIWLMPLFHRLVNRNSLWIVVVGGVALSAITDYWLFRNLVIANLGDRLFIYWVGYAFLGIAFARGYSRPFPLLLLVAIIALLAAPIEFEHLVGAQGRVSPYLLPSVSIGSTALLFALGLRPSNLTISARHSSNWLNNVVLFVGRNSMVIFVANPLLLECARRIGFGLIHTNILFKLTSIVFAVVGSLAIGRIFRKLNMGVLVGA